MTLNYRSILSLILSISVLYFSGFSQTKEDITRLKEINDSIRSVMRGSRNVEEMKRLRGEYLNIISHSKSFIAFTIGYEISKADVNELLADLNSKGFPAIKDKFGAIAFGYSRMNKKIAGNWLFNVVPGNNISNSDYEISLRGAGSSFDKGYAFVYTDNLILHAFAGIGWQYHTIKQSKKNDTTSGNGLFTLVPGSSTGKITQNMYHGSFGMQLDFNASYKKSSNFGIQTGIRFSYNPVVIKGKYKYSDNDSEYHPKINWRQYNLSILIKLFSKTYFRR